VESLRSRLSRDFEQLFSEITEQRRLNRGTLIQSLWGGYGSIVRVPVAWEELGSVVVKEIRFPAGTDGDLVGHERKVRSFQVESHWYESWSHRCSGLCRSAQSYGTVRSGDEVSIILEDLNESGFTDRARWITEDQFRAVVRWLAHFHVTFLGESPDSLWPIGTYWHLGTRRKELRNLRDRSLAEVAHAIDSALNSSSFQTIVHGDAKLDNFCFTPDGKSSAAVDFQYVGGGVGVKDLAYFMGSAFPEWECERREQELLDLYFEELRAAVQRVGKMVNVEELERSWRPLYRLAWADFHRFAEGWKPNYWASNGYSSKVVASVIASFADLASE